MSINRVIISGNLTRDPELRSTASGLPVLGFGVAVNDRRKNQQTGEWEDYPNFIDCTMFGARAESLSRYLGKGTKVAIEGKLRWSQWEREGGLFVSQGRHCSFRDVSCETSLRAAANRRGCCAWSVGCSSIRGRGFR